MYRKKDIEYLSSLGTFGAYFVSAKFDNIKADQHYSANYSIPREIQHWYSSSLTSPKEETFNAFDLRPFRLMDIRAVLKAANKSSAPGPDGISFSVFLKLESTHHIMATFYLWAPPFLLG